MLKYEDILNAFTLEISKNFNEDIFVDDYNIQDCKKSCFLVQIFPNKTIAINTTINQKSILLSIKFFQQARQKKKKLYEVLYKLQKIFVRGLKIKDRVLDVSNVESNILKDEIGYFLDYIITINYFDNADIEQEKYEMMQEINIDIGGK
ncbi:TPA: hypothetical protein KOS69_003539 [Clostridioides difficile]|uniref:Phage protein n=1 Tax=Clostridioides difficile TaxID=1496 RepID=A0AB74QHR4_CLODI|nr:hypothetical protein [Clostridioides difficile]EGT4205338.1 hypothetical protein [Clostridioides difficile]MBY1604035.1 hypothetical protein [Clostridioides difficile]MBY1715188.1 hypothetical protein [Clostridioides difficile]MBY1799559.1 hypothetical protein [Clostridioides difficile]MBY2026503.1 hypothetical protein [Clostridioides difficile]